jgi:acetyl-CoA synthetase
LLEIASYKLGAVAIPLFTLFGTDALEYRLSNSEAKGIVTDAANLPKIMEIWRNLPHLKTVLVTGGEKPQNVLDFQAVVAKGSAVFQPVTTRADDPALIIYTSFIRGDTIELTPLHICSSWEVIISDIHIIP